MKDYDRTLLSDSQFLDIKPGILKAFADFVPRSKFINNNSELEESNRSALDVSEEQPNILSYPTTHYPTTIPNISNFHDVFGGFESYDLINNKFKCVDEYVARNTTGVKTSFITFSTNITGAKIGVKHLHSLLNKDRCNVWSFCIPLYISDSADTAGFWYNSQQDLFPPRYYVDYERVKKLQVEYTSIKMPKDGKILSLMFDGSRSPHYIDYTDHLYAFMVFDGITTKDNLDLGKKWITELL